MLDNSQVETCVKANFCTKSGLTKFLVERELTIEKLNSFHFSTKLRDLQQCVNPGDAQEIHEHQFIFFSKISLDLILAEHFICVNILKP